jgi:DNA polymerase-4
VRETSRPRSILHVDLEAFFVSVERSLDPSLRGRAVVVGGGVAAVGSVAACSTEARAEGVEPGQSVAKAQTLCPEAVVRPGDFEAYARASEDVTEVLLAHSPRVERPSSDEAFVDLTPDERSLRKSSPVAAAEEIKDQIQKRLGLDASLGLASSRLAARVASRWARPRGLLLVLPGYEASFLERQPIEVLPEMPPHLHTALTKAGLTTLGTVASADEETLVEAVGTVAAPRLQRAARGVGEEPIEPAAPPTSVQQEMALRVRAERPEDVLDLLDGLVARALRRVRPFSLGVGQLAVEVRRSQGATRRSVSFEEAIREEPRLRDAARLLAEPLVAPADGVRGLQLRFARLSRPSPQAPLFPELFGVPRSSLG